MKNDYPIDFVVMWVDSNDPNWLLKKESFLPKEVISNAVSNHRFRDWDIFKFWFRGVEKFAPWVNKIYLVTDKQVPSFLDVSSNKLVIVDHTEIIDEKYLPTFNSNAIEINIHKITGLSEHFVFFNDDMFLINHVLKSDFFENGLPKASAISNVITGIGDEPIHSISLNDVALINKYFNKKSVIKQSLSNWFSPKYGLNLYRSIVLLPWGQFTGFLEDHLPNSFLKSTFIELWDKENVALNRTMTYKFRNQSNLNQWLFKYWQFAKNSFVPRTPKFGQHFDVTLENVNECCDYILNKKGFMVCINDVVNDNDLQIIQPKIHDSFMAILPDKSDFEI